MPTELGDPYQITWRGDPPQMLQADIPLWWKFVDQFGGWFEKFYYNVRVGGPDISKIQGSEEIKKMWYASTAKRIDVIGERTKDLWIIEVAHSPYLRAVGQMVSYEYLWNLDPKINKPVKSLLLCPYIDADLLIILKHTGVTICTMYENEPTKFDPVP